MAANDKGKVLFILHPKQGRVTVYLRGLIFRDLLLKNGWDVTFVNISKESFNNELDSLRKSTEEVISMAENFDIVYLLKVNSLSFVKRLRKQTKARIVFELTDALWKPFFRFGGWHNLEEILELSTAIFSENEYVCEYGRRYNRHVYSLRACTQTEKFEKARQESLPSKADKIVLGWIGSPETVTAIFTIIEPLESLFSKYRNLELRIVGSDERRVKNILKNIRYTVRENYNEQDMISEALWMDICLFPAPSDMDDYKIRGALKAMIYMSAAKPAVCLNAGDCSRIIQDGINGMLINSVDEWVTKIEKLILSPQLRKSMGNRAYNTIREGHSLNKAFEDLDNALSDVMRLEGSNRVSRTFGGRMKRLLLKIRILSMIPPMALKKIRQRLQQISRFHLLNFKYF